MRRMALEHVQDGVEETDGAPRGIDGREGTEK